MSNKPKKSQARRLTKASTEMKETNHFIAGMHHHEHEHNHQLTISPFLPASEMERIYDLDPSILTIIMETTKIQVQSDIQNREDKIELERKEQSIREKEVEGEIAIKTRGQKYGLMAMFFLGSVTVALVYFEAYKTAAAFATVTIVGGITAFTGLGKRITKKTKSKDITKADKKS